MMPAFTTLDVMRDQSAISLKKMAMHASNHVRTIQLEIAITSPGLMLDSTLDSVFTSPHAIPMIQVVCTATPDPNHETIALQLNGLTDIQQVEDDVEDEDTVTFSKH